MDLETAIKMAEKEALIGEGLKGHISQDWPKALRLLVKEARKNQ